MLNSFITQHTPKDRAQEFAVQRRVQSASSVASTYSTDSKQASCRYSLIDATPETFDRDCFTLAQKRSGLGCEVVIAITCYNEGPELFLRSIQGVCDNLPTLYSHIQSADKSKHMGWQKVVVMITIDGREIASAESIAALESVGCINTPILQADNLSCPIAAHIWESTVDLTKFPGVNAKEPVVAQVIVCLKEKNCGRISSDRWCMSGVARHLDARFCILLDVGTTALDGALSGMWEELDQNDDVAGACGAMSVYSINGSSANPLVAGRAVEYGNVGQFLRRYESTTGLLTVLQGAFVIFRVSALTADVMAQYLAADNRSLNRTEENSSLLALNRNLAEDRITCFELLAAPEQWRLSFIPHVRSTTDTPATVNEFLQQSRRWNNGAAAASIWRLKNWKRLYHPTTSLQRRALLSIQGFYVINELLTSFTEVSNQPLFNVIALAPLFGVPISSFSLTGGDEPQLPTLLRNVLLAAISLTIMNIVLCLWTKPQHSPRLFRLAVLLGVPISLFNTVALTITCYGSLRRVQDFPFLPPAELAWNLVLVTLGNLHVFVPWAAVLLFPPVSAVWNVLCYFGLARNAPVVQAYCLCSINDVTWGTKGQSATVDSKAEVGAKQAARTRNSTVAIWLVLNVGIMLLPLFRFRLAVIYSMFYGVLSLITLVLKCIGCVIGNTGKVATATKKYIAHMKPVLSRIGTFRTPQKELPNFLEKEA